MYRIHITIDINSPMDRVWRALCDPKEVVKWDTTVVEALDVPPDYPLPGQRVRWRIQGTSAVLHDSPQTVEPPTRLRSLLAIGRDRLDESYTLSGDSTRTTLTCYVELRTAVPLLGLAVERLRTGPAARRSFDTSLAALKHHCETHI
jgi:uncharacterized protein YndB with AHSA1/START domain